MKRHLFGIVQGRLIQAPKGQLQHFPQEYWESEFFIARSIGLDFMELIVERDHNLQNPIWTNDGIQKINQLCEINSLQKPTVCNDFVIDHSLLSNNTAIDQTIRVISQAAKLGSGMLILPLFEKGELNEENVLLFKAPLLKIADYAAKNGMVVCLETILKGQVLLQFLRDFNHPNLKCVFDTGNRIAFGHDIYSDIVSLGDCIGHVHIKDKNHKNENVLLSTGDVDFHKAFLSLAKIKYEGAFTFETFRGIDPIATAQFNLQLTSFFLRESSKNADR